MTSAATPRRRTGPTPWAGTRAVVTGGAGVVGAWLCERLLELGAEVVCVDDLSIGRLENLEHLAGEPGLIVI